MNREQMHRQRSAWLRPGAMMGWWAPSLPEPTRSVWSLPWRPLSGGPTLDDLEMKLSGVLRTARPDPQEAVAELAYAMKPRLGSGNPLLPLESDSPDSAATKLAMMMPGGLFPNVARLRVSQSLAETLSRNHEPWMLGSLLSILATEGYGSASSATPAQRRRRPGPQYSESRL